MGALGGLLNGMVAGRQLRMQMQREALQNQLTQKELARQSQNDSMKMLNDRLSLEMMGARPVNNGMVDEMLSTQTPEQSSAPSSPAPSSSSVMGDMLGTTPGTGGPAIADKAPVAQGGMPVPTALGAPPAPAMPDVANVAPTATGGIKRKANKAQTVTIPWANGENLQYELPTAQEQLQRQAQLAQAAQLREKMGLAQANQYVLQAFGKPAGPDIVKAFPGMSGALLMPDEQKEWAQKAAEMHQKALVKLGPAENLLDTSGYATNGQQGSGLRLVASGGPPLPTGDFEKVWLPKVAATLKNADGTPKTVAQMTTEEVAKAAGQWKEANADPETRAANIAAKNAALATAALSNTLKQIQIGQAPTKDDAAMLADDIRNHRLAPDQFTAIRGRGNGGLGLMIEREMHKTDPEFDWERAASEYQFAKSPQFQNTVRYMDSVQESIPLLVKRATQLSNGNVRSLNSLINAGKNQFNDIDLKRFETDRTLVADEIAKILQGGGGSGGTSDMKLRQAGEILKSSDSPQAIAAALTDVQDLIGYRRSALTKGTYLERTDAGLNSQTPGTGGSGHVIELNGKHYQYNGTGDTADLKNYTEVK